MPRYFPQQWVFSGASFNLRINFILYELFLKKLANPGLFIIYFWSFQKNNTIFTTNHCEKCPSSIQRQDPRPRKHESSPITTRPGIPPYTAVFKVMLITNLASSVDPPILPFFIPKVRIPSTTTFTLFSIYF